MITPEILPLLRCPATGGPLTLADDVMVARVNETIAAGIARDFLDQPVTGAIEGGLVNAAADRLYPIRETIPTLIVDEAIRL